MPASIKNRPRKLIIAKLILELMRENTENIFTDEPFASRAMDGLLMIAVFVGHAEGRQMTARKIAEYIGAPRPTAIRRLNLLETFGFVLKTDDGTYRLPTPRFQTAARDAAINRMSQLILRASRALSKLDA